MPRCGKCGSELVEDVDGFLLGFLACPKCKNIPDEIIEEIDEAA